ncbi:MAG: hypothetical protein QGG40_19035, partial [Myxococcota bacterium]|nr:hypothetical protein [Myxococcota bacterium]
EIAVLTGERGESNSEVLQQALITLSAAAAEPDDFRLLLQLVAKRPDLSSSQELGTEFDEAFGSDLLRLPIAGMPRLNESLFLHRASGTLVTTDLCFHLPESTGMTGLFARVMGIHDKTRCEPLFLALVRDRTAFRASLEPLRSMEIHHLSMCHHSVLSVEATDALQQVLDQVKVP